MGTAEDLKKTDLFQEVDMEDLKALVSHMHQESYSEGTILFQEGDPGDTLYIITSGKIRIFFHDKEGNQITLKFYGEHDIFGELSPIDERPRSASADAAEALKVMARGRAEFLEFLEERPQIGLAMMRSLAERLRYTTTYLEEFTPERFTTKIEDRGEEFRRPAQKEMAEILDKIIQKSEEQENKNNKEDLPFRPAERADSVPPAEMPKERLHGIFDLGGHADEEVEPISEDMGIFGKLGGSLANRETEEQDKD